ncbi:MAG: phosphate ABC transporter substrate-binding protein [Clostridia bacterium]|nr:phosphate ABC transporter substrate-binding protein [Clostridia bacterium]
MKKTIGIVLIALLLAAVMAGCGATTPPATTAPAANVTEAPAANNTEAPVSILAGIVKTGGSTSVEKVMNALRFQFVEDNPGVTVEYEANGSGDGIKNTISGQYELGHSSRELKTDGTEDGLTAIAYAIDGIAIVVHPDNGVESLTKDQIKKIYTGEIKNWSEVGGEDGLVTVITREESSGTRAAFAEIVGLEKKDDDATKIVAEATTCGDTGTVQTTVAGNNKAIGYLSYSDVNENAVKTVKYEDVAITVETLKDGSYKLMREFFLLTKDGETLSEAAQAFVDFVTGTEGQAIVAANKLLPK